MVEHRQRKIGNHQILPPLEGARLGIQISGYRPVSSRLEGPVRGFNRVYLQHVA
jgi:hypothetical protein